MSMRPSQILLSSPCACGSAPSCYPSYHASYQKTCNSNENMLRFLVRNADAGAALPEREDYNTEQTRFRKG